MESRVKWNGGGNVCYQGAREKDRERAESPSIKWRPALNKRYIICFKKVKGRKNIGAQR